MVLLDLSGSISHSSLWLSPKSSRDLKRIFALTSHSLSWWLLQKTWQFSIWKIFQSRFRATCLMLWSSCKQRNLGKSRTRERCPVLLLKRHLLKMASKAWPRTMENNWISRRRVPTPSSCSKIENFLTISKISLIIQKLTTQPRIFGYFVKVSKSSTTNKVLYQ